jgi:hypothetical protein
MNILSNTRIFIAFFILWLILFEGFQDIERVISNIWIKNKPVPQLKVFDVKNLYWQASQLISLHRLIFFKACGSLLLHSFRHSVAKKLTGNV